MSKSPTKLAKEVLESDGGLEELRVHEFEDDESAHDDDVIEHLYAEFSDELDTVAAELSKKYGKPSRTGAEDAEAIPLNGVFKFAVWDMEGQQLFVAAAHEDRGAPIVLMIGTAE